ncbi:MAG: hypothetical protein ABSC06_22385 [Rhodopila sp.]|jgi:hypothetical protein
MIWNKHRFVSDIPAARCVFCSKMRMELTDPCTSDPDSKAKADSLRRAIGAPPTSPTGIVR